MTYLAPARRPSPLSIVLCVAAGLSSAIACDGGDDTVYPNPLPSGGNRGVGGSRTGGGAGADRAGSGGGSGAKAGGSGGLGGVGSGSGTGGAAGLGGSAGAGAGIGGSAGASAGSGGTAGGAGSAGIGGVSGGGGTKPTSPYVSACASFEAALDSCDAVADSAAKAAGDACRASEACATLVYGEMASGVLACSQLACSVPTFVNATTFDCLESSGTLTPEAKVAFLTFRQSLANAADTCAAQGDSASKAAIIVTAVRGFPLGARAGLFAGLASCTSEPCPQIASCVASRVAAICSGPAFFWNATDLSAGTD